VEGADILLAIAGLALSFAGFSTVVVLFQRGDYQTWPVHVVLRLRTMVYVSLTTLFFALWPFGLYHLGLTGQTLWSISSGLMLLVGTLLYAEIVTRSRPWLSSRGLSVRFTVVTGFVVVTALILQFLNVTGLFWTARFGVYLVGLLWLLVVAGLMFVRLVSFPDPPG
jgi:hypothetical protein